MIKPLNNNVILKKEKQKNQTASGIILSNTEEDTEYAIVVSVSDSFCNEKGESVPCNLKVGQKVIFKSYSTTKIKYQDEEYLVSDCKDILAVIE